jgi:hypothetical protein
MLELWPNIFNNLHLLSIIKYIGLVSIIMGLYHKYWARWLYLILTLYKQAAFR